MSTETEKLMQRVRALITELEAVSAAHPYLVIFLMHEIMRLLFPSDPFIPDADDKHPIDRVSEAVDRAAAALAALRGFGSYSGGVTAGPEAAFDDIRDATGDVYGKIWSVGEAEEMVLSAKAAVEERFLKNEIPLDHIKGSRVLDMGAGSGRYTCALALLGADEVTGVDFGDAGLAQGARLAEVFGLDNVRFEKADFLDLPFEDNSFDFIFCNGAVHHSTDMAQATHELHRVLKPGRPAWYYVYGAGGVFWETLGLLNDMMKRTDIPQEYAMQVLDLIGMPNVRHLFIDQWYVPIFKTTRAEDFETMLKDAGFAEFRRCTKGRPTDFDELAVYGSEKDKLMWGEGKLYYLVTK
ncbi:MAG: class I SAM-dependent methyltransferase [Rhodospirillales bacterium]